MPSLTNSETILKLVAQAERWEKIANPLGKFYKQFEYVNRFEHLTRASEVARLAAGPAWLNKPAFTAIQQIAALYQPPRGLADLTKGLAAFNQLEKAVALPPALQHQVTALDLVQKSFFKNWTAAASVANQFGLPAKIEQLQAQFGNTFAQLAETSAAAHTEEAAASTASISADLLALGSEILTNQRVTAEATSKLAAIAERYEQRVLSPVAEAAAETQIARDTLHATHQSLSIQVINMVVSALVSILVALLPIYLAKHPDPADQAVTQQQFADWQTQLATFATHAAAPLKAERIALRSVQVRAYPRQTADTVGLLLKGVLASVWATQGKWAQVSYLDVDGLPSQGWVRRNSLGWPSASQPTKAGRKSVAQRR